MAVSSKWTWADFVRRCRSRTLGRQDIDALFYRILLPWWVINGLGGLFIDVEVRPFLDLTGRYVLFTLAPLWIGLMGLLSYCAPPRKSSESFPLAWMFIWPVVVGFILAFMSVIGVVWVNALFGSQETVLVHGPVIALHKPNNTRFSGMSRDLTISFEHRLVTLSVPARDYEQIRVGDEYAVKMKRGALGYLYRWHKDPRY